MTDSMIELKETLANEALETWRDLRRRRDADPEVVELEEQLERLNERVDDTRKQLIALDRERYDPAIATTEEKLSELVFDLAFSVETDGARAEFTSGYVRVTYDAKGLDRVLVKNPAIAEIINPHRKEKDVAPRIKLELFEVEEGDEA